MSVQTSSQLSVSASGASHCGIRSSLVHAAIFPILTVLSPQPSPPSCLIAGQRNMDQFKKDFKHGINQILSLPLPKFMMYLMIFSIPLVSIIGASKFTEDRLPVNPAIVLDWSVALPLYGIGMYLQKGLFCAYRRMTLCCFGNAQFCRARFWCCGGHFSLLA